ncbi:MAG: hypothetical protein ABSD90_13825, partial [Methylocystis sp.]
QNRSEAEQRSWRNSLVRHVESDRCRFGKSHRVTLCEIWYYAGLFEVSEAALARIQQAAGIDGSVLETQLADVALASAA